MKRKTSITTIVRKFKTKCLSLNDWPSTMHNQKGNPILHSKQMIILRYEDHKAYPQTPIS